MCRQLLSSVTVSFYINLSHTHTFLKIVFIVFHPKVSKCIVRNIVEVYLYFWTEGAPPSLKSHI